MEEGLSLKRERTASFGWETPQKGWKNWENEETLPDKRNIEIKWDQRERSRSVFQKGWADPVARLWSYKA